MQPAKQTAPIASIGSMPTADFCDTYPGAEVLHNRFLSFGGKSACVGPVEIIATRDDNSLVKSTLSEPGDGRVLLVDNNESINCAMLGGNLAKLAADNGWAGIVINGAVRDVDELKVAPIAVFALATCPRRSQKCGHGRRGQPVRVAGTLLRSDDIIAADSDGVVTLASWAVSRPNS
ncbi:MAG: ribonuclease E activity regulator RraA [Gammaproteobacteria bacterium]|nr:ribonuclease E activity regulator RraA [Gammaproteobacteria bacterium]MDH3432377.1 ribonuclease E activity regulator RraA [Gammaproteobacteria bacterium]